MDDRREKAAAREVCRTCLSSQALAPLFPKPMQYRSLQLTLRLSTGLQVDCNDGLPQFLCKNCSQCIEAFMLFRFQSRIVNQKLRHLCRESTAGGTFESNPLSLKLESLPTPNEIKIEAKRKHSKFNNTRIHKQFLKVPSEENADGHTMDTLSSFDTATVKHEVSSDTDENFDQYLDITDLFDRDNIQPNAPSEDKIMPKLRIVRAFLKNEKSLETTSGNSTTNCESEDSFQVGAPEKLIEINIPSEYELLNDCKVENSGDKMTSGLPLTSRVGKSKLIKPRSRAKRLKLKDAFDANSTNLKCKYCNDTYNKFEMYIRHQREIHSGFEFVCAHCTKGFSLRSSIVRHLRISHPLPKKASSRKRTKKNSDSTEEFQKKCTELMEGPYDKNSETIKCKLCESVYKSITAFRGHAQVHLGYRHVCEFCQNGYQTQFCLVKHIQKKHTEKLKENPMLLPVAQRRATRPRRVPDEFKLRCLELVDPTYEGGGRGVRCVVCRVVCRDKQIFGNHAQLHLGYQHLCELCARGFTSKFYLKQHLQASHGLARELCCSYCDYRAVLRNQLKIHERRFHTNERPFVCETCGAAYFSKTVLTQHIQLGHHTGKRYKCDECSRTFRLPRELTYHKKHFHTLARTYPCQICSSSFKTPASVRKHYLKIHKIPRDQQVEKLERLYFGQLPVKHFEL